MNENGVCGDDGSNKKATKKKKVSFKFSLETSDDAHIVKKEPNTTFDPPVSIIKKECLTRAIRGESIIMPSRLTGVIKKFDPSNANIDKLNSLTFKSQNAKKDTTSEENVSSNDDEQSDAGADNSERRRDSDDNTDNDDESSHSKNDDDNDEHSKNVAFQLPKRSSRVIKPNKRFTDDSKLALNKNGLGKKKGSKLDNDGDSMEVTKKEGIYDSKY